MLLSFCHLANSCSFFLYCAISCSTTPFNYALTTPTATVPPSASLPAQEELSPQSVQLRSRQSSENIFCRPASVLDCLLVWTGVSLHLCITTVCSSDWDSKSVSFSTSYALAFPSADIQPVNSPSWHCTALVTPQSCSVSPFRDVCPEKFGVNMNIRLHYITICCLANKKGQFLVSKPG
jgi:hypothetical protein